MRALIEDGRAHVVDGAMGTLLYARGVFVNVCYDELNLSRPDLVRGIHDEYVTAGAEIIETNTFGANPIKLSSFGLEERTEEVNRTAAQIAVDASNGRASVAGAIGPLGIRIEPWGPTSIEEAEAYFRRQVEGLLEGGVDGFILETFADPAELACAVRAVRATCDLPVVAQVTVGQNGKSALGRDAGQLADDLARTGADVVGLNCSVGPAVMLDAIEEMGEATSLPLSAQPNAGLPRTVRDRKIYLASPEYMAQYATRMISVGARFVGGCCGTTPEHTRVLRAAVESSRPRAAGVAVPRTIEASSTEQEPVPLDTRSALGRKLARSEPVVSIELLPPNSWDAAELVRPARALKVAGVDVVTVLDSARSGSRMSALSAALIIEREVGIETVPHYTCRDKNMLGMVSDLLGAAANGLHNLLVVSGNPSTLGPYPDATVVFDIDSIGLTNVIQGLNRGVDPSGSSIGAPTTFVQGVALNQGAVDHERELSRLGYKADAGADFAVTQPVFSAEMLESFLEEAARDRPSVQRLPIVAGIWPLADLRTAEFLANEVPGVRVPDSVVERMRTADESGPEAATEEGMAIALEIIEAIRPLVQGFHLTAARREVDLPLRVLRESGLSATA